MEPDTPHDNLRLGQLNRLEHETLASLIGRPPRYTKSMQLDLAAIDTALRDAGIATCLRDALEQLDGPIVHLATAHADAQARWSAVASDCHHPKLTSYLQTPAGLGLLKRLARQDTEAAARLRDRAERVLQRLPAGGLPRAQLAAQTLGNAHALDSGQATATLVVAAWRQHEEGYPDTDAPEDMPDGPREERVRDVWARAGVLVNELARPTLHLNLPTRGQEPPFSATGEPGYVSLRRLLRAQPAWAVAGHTIFVCENPNLVAIAADLLGERCAPLVCTDGMPAAAQRTLLTQLAQSGARLLYHGDFDWPGLHIANHVMRAYGAQPWRFGAVDYEAAVSCVPHQEHRLSGMPVPASWDAALAPAMQTHGLAIPEEGLAASLLQDLQR
ncbi:MAG: TIGR02679 family protein [Burkholderiales bacterium]